MQPHDDVIFIPTPQVFDHETAAAFQRKYACLQDEKCT